MPAGLQVFDGGANLFWDTAMFMGRSLGFADIGTATGQGVITDDRFTTGIGWAVPVLSTTRDMYQTADGSFVNINNWLGAPNVYFNGNQMVWTRSPSAYPTQWEYPSCRIYYGVR